MPKSLNLVGQQFGRLTPIRLSTKVGLNGLKYWICKCSCGKFTTARVSSLRNGHTRSCGCLHIEAMRSNGLSNTSHGFSANGIQHRFYMVWAHVKSRCFNQNTKDYKNYGGRGIRMYPHWVDDPSEFINYIGSLPNSDDSTLSLDRINNDGNYEPGNLRWATRSQQNNNQRTNVPLWKVDAIKDKLKNSFMSKKAITTLFKVDIETVNKIKRELASARRAEYNPG